MGLFSLIQRVRDRALAQQEAEAEALRLSQEAVATVQDAIATSITPEDTEVTVSVESDVAPSFQAQGQYTKERRVRGTFVPSIVNGVIQRGSLSSGGTPTQPATQIVPGPEIKFSITDINKASYTWKGNFGFDNAEYEFVIRATNQFRVLVDGETIIDDYTSGPTRTRTHRTGITAGNHEVTIIWSPNGQNTLDFNFARVFAISWISCVDGEEREGLPPDTWTKTASGCFKPPLTDDEGVVDLLQVIDISPDANSRIERAYVKGSGTALSSHRLKFLNRSTNMTIGVRLSGPKPVRFVTARTLVGDVGVGGLPADGFELGTRETKEVDVVFISSEIDPLPEGVIRSDILVGVTPGTITISKDGDDNIDIGTPIPDGDPVLLPPDPIEPPPPPPPPTPTWRDCSGATEVERDGFPPTDWTIRADGCYVPPVPVAPAVSLVITSVEFPAQFDGSTAIASANLRPTITAGRSAWNWQWNFDVNRQGAGTGNTTAQDPVASWRMTFDDLRTLQQSGRITRVVEAIATRRGGLDAGQIVRAKHTVVLDNTGLEFIGDITEIEGGRTGENPESLLGGGFLDLDESSFE